MTAQRGRPAIPYETFVGAWEMLLKQRQATTNQAHERLGGNKGTIAKYRERYENQQSIQRSVIVNHIQLTDAVHEVIANIKVKEIELLESDNKALKVRIEEYLGLVTASEMRRTEAQVAFEDAQFNFDSEKLKLERQLAVAQSKISDLIEREAKLMQRIEQLNTECNAVRQQAAVSQKEV